MQTADNLRVTLMMNIKKNLEHIKIFLRASEFICDWASVSKKRTHVLCFAITLALPVPFIYLSWHYQTINHLNTLSYQSVLNNKAIAQSYNSALDAIASCMKSKTYEPNLHEWYCEHASLLYKGLPGRLNQSRSIELINKKAYLAMQDNIKHDLRGIEILNLINTPPTKNEEMLNTILSVNFLVIYTITSVLIIGAFVFLLAHYRSKKQQTIIITLDN